VKKIYRLLVDKFVHIFVMGEGKRQKLYVKKKIRVVNDELFALKIVLLSISF